MTDRSRRNFLKTSVRSIPRHIYCAALAAAMLLAATTGACAQPTPGQATSAAGAKPLPFVSPIFGDNQRNRGYSFGYRHQFGLITDNYAKLLMGSHLWIFDITLNFAYLS